MDGRTDGCTYDAMKHKEDKVTHHHLFRKNLEWLSEKSKSYRIRIWYDKTHSAKKKENQVDFIGENPREKSWKIVNLEMLFKMRLIEMNHFA